MSGTFAARERVSTSFPGAVLFDDIPLPSPNGVTTSDALLRKVLIRTFSDQAELRLLATDTGLTLARLNLHQAAELAWQEVLEECRKQGSSMLEGLVNVCVERAPALGSDAVIQQVLQPASDAAPVNGASRQPGSTSTTGEAQPSASPATAAPLKLPSTLLHISDLHFGQARGSGADHFTQEKVVAELVKDATAMGYRRQTFRERLSLVTGILSTP